MKALLVIATLCLLFLGCIGNQGGNMPPPPVPSQTPPPSPPPPPPKENQTGLPNPASKFCVDAGYRLQIRTTSSGQVGYCVFTNGNECEEWAFFRGECNENGAVRVPAAEGEFCGGIAGIACQDGLNCKLEGSYPDAGGICVKPGQKSDNNFYACPPDRNEQCTQEASPVCGRAVSGGSEVAGYKDYANACEACSTLSNAIGYYKGDCLSRQP